MIDVIRFYSANAEYGCFSVLSTHRCLILHAR